MRRIYTPDAFKIPTGNGWDFDLQQFTGSGAGLNYVNKVFLTPQGQPLMFSPISGGGTIDSGVQCAEARHFTKWLIHLIALNGDPTTALTGWEVVLYGTADGRAVQRPPLPTSGATLPASSWCKIVAPSAEGSTPIWYNPIEDYGQALYTPVPWVAIKCIATCASGATGSFAVQVEAVP